jgi:DNA-binding PadR family transcriptional regulator
VHLRGATRLTDGNLATHARRLHSAGLVEIDKSFRDGRPVTTYTLTPQGRNALESHVQRLVDALQPPSTTAFQPSFATAPPEDDNWID